MLNSRAFCSQFPVASFAGPCRRCSSGTLVDLFRHACVMHGTQSTRRVFLRYKDRRPHLDQTWRVLCYSQLWDVVSQYRTSLATAGVKKGSIVALYGDRQSHAEWTMAMFAVSLLEATLLPLDYQLPAARVAQLVENFRVGHVITSPTRAALISELKNVKILNLHYWGLEDLSKETNFFESFVHHDVVPAIVARPDAVAALVLTSGTSTGMPKGVKLTQHNIFSNVVNIHHHLTSGGTPSLDRYMSVLPQHHVFELVCGTLVPMLSGAEIVVCPSLRPDVILSTLQTFCIHSVFGVPLLFRLLADGIRKEIRAFSPAKRRLVELMLRLSYLSRMYLFRNNSRMSAKVGQFFFHAVHSRFGGKVQGFVSGGAALDPATCELFAALGMPIFEGFGATETTAVVTANNMLHWRAGSVGRPLKNMQVVIADPDDEGVGEIIVKGPAVFAGYLLPGLGDQPQPHLDEDGFYRTGDLGWMDSDGYLYVSGRRGDMIVTAAGKKAYPDEVEAAYSAALRSSPAIAPSLGDVIVVGLPVEGTRSEEVALVISRSNPKETGENFEELVQQAVSTISSALSSHQRASRLVFWPADAVLPKTATLKVQRSVLKKMLPDIVHKQHATVSPTAADVSSAQAKSFMSHTKSATLAKQGGRSREPMINLFGHSNTLPLSPGSSDSRRVEMLGRVTKLVQEVSSRDVHDAQLTDKTELTTELGIDSMRLLQLLSLLDKEFAIKIAQATLARARTLGDVVDVVAAAPAATEASNAATSGEIAERLHSFLAMEPLPGESLPTVSSFWAASARWGMQMLIRQFCYRFLSMQVVGLENIKQISGACLIAPNHSSHLDAACLLAILNADSVHEPLLLALLGAQDYFFSSTFRGLVSQHLLGVVPFDRHGDFTKSLRTGALLLHHQRRVVIFPEGTRSSTGQLQPFKPGIGALSAAARVPIVPVFLTGTYQSLPPQASFPKRGRVTVTFGPPIHLMAKVSFPSLEDNQAVADAVKFSIECMKTYHFVKDTAGIKVDLVDKLDLIRMLRLEVGIRLTESHITGIMQCDPPLQISFANFMRIMTPSLD